MAKPPFLSVFRVCGAYAKLSLFWLVLGGSVLGFDTDLVFPWVTNQPQFGTRIVIENLNPNPAELTLTARRQAVDNQDGESETVNHMLAPFEQWVVESGDLFPSLGAGGGYMVRLQSEADLIQGGFVITGTQSASGSSPSQGNLALTGQAAPILLFNYLPLADDGFSAPVVVNTGDTTATVRFHAFQNGVIAATAEREVKSFHPLAQVAQNLFPDLTGDTYVVAESDQPLLGLAFIFNDLLEPSLANAVALAAVPDPTAANAGQVTNLEGSDVGDRGTGADLSVAFEKVEHEDRVAEYRLFVVRDENAGTFDLAAAQASPDDSFTVFPKTGANLEMILSDDSRDQGGNGIASNVDYRLFVQTVADGVLSTRDSLTEAETPVRLTIEASTVYTLRDQIAASGGVAVDPQGNVYVGDFGYSLNSANGTNLYKLTPGGTAEIFATGFVSITGMNFDGEGNLFLSNFAGGFVSKVTPDGTVSTFAPGIQGPVGIAIDNEGNLFVGQCGANTIRHVPPEGGTSTVFASGNGLSCPNGLTIDPDTNILYASNFNDGRVFVIGLDGTVTFLATVPGGRAPHLTFVDGVLYAVGALSHRIFKVTLDGQVTTIAGTGARGGVDGPALQATFSIPNGIGVSPSKDKLYTNDVALNSGSNFHPTRVRAISIVP